MTSVGTSLPVGSLMHAWQPGDATEKLVGVRLPLRDSALRDQR